MKTGTCKVPPVSKEGTPRLSYSLPSVEQGKGKCWHLKVVSSQTSQKWGLIFYYTYVCTCVCYMYVRRKGLVWNITTFSPVPSMT